MTSLSDNSIDLLLTDIPYGKVNKQSHGLRNIDKKEANTETFDLQTFATESYRVTKGSGIIFCGKEQFSFLYEFFDENKCTTRMIIWEKTNPMPMNAKFVFLSGVECAIYFKKKGATFNGNYLNTVFRLPKGTSKRHPTEKPIKLFRDFVELLTNPNDLVLDPCVGSGTTAVACLHTNRNYICCDINPHYIIIAKNRLKNEK